MSHLVKMVTPEGGTCLDPFCGSGTTGIACKKTNRNAVLIDSDANSIGVAEKRIEDFSEDCDGEENQLTIPME